MPDVIRCYKWEIVMKVIDPGLFEVIVGGNSGSASGQAGATGAPMKCVVNSTKDSMVTMCDAGGQIITMACQTSTAQVTVQIGNKVVGAKAGVNTTTPSCTMTVTIRRQGVAPPPRAKIHFDPSRIKLCCLTS